MRKLINNKLGDVRMVGVLVAVLVTIVIGLVVYWNVGNAANITSTDGRSAWSNVNTTAGTVFTLAPIVAIVLIASIILGAVMQFGRRGGGGV